MPLPNHLIIRAANLEDVQSIITFSAAMALETENRRLDEARLREGTLSLLSTASYGFFMVADLHDGKQHRLIGQLMITYEWSDWRNGVFWWIQSVYVDPAWRRRGVFRRMHNEVVVQARADPKVCGIRLYVEQENHTAEAVYQRVGLARSAYRVYENDFVLAKDK
jgi:ribosomal protein S18 acetylase RimI-like enzyme